MSTFLVRVFDLDGPLSCASVEIDSKQARHYVSLCRQAADLGKMYDVFPASFISILDSLPTWYRDLPEEMDDDSLIEGPILTTRPNLSGEDVDSVYVTAGNDGIYFEGRWGDIHVETDTFSLETLLKIAKG